MEVYEKSLKVYATQHGEGETLAEALFLVGNFLRKLAKRDCAIQFLTRSVSAD